MRLGGVLLAGTIGFVLPLWVWVQALDLIGTMGLLGNGEFDVLLGIVIVAVTPAASCAVAAIPSLRIFGLAALVGSAIPSVGMLALMLSK